MHIQSTSVFLFMITLFFFFQEDSIIFKATQPKDGENKGSAIHSVHGRAHHRLGRENLLIH